jgi:hypothetical protein
MSFWRYAPIMDNLVPYLSVVDYINLKRAAIRMVTIISPAELLFQRLVARLKSFIGLDQTLVSALIRLLSTRDDFYLSGGFLVALLRGDEFNVSVQDLDFFVTKDSYESSSKFPGLDVIRYTIPPALESEEEYAHVMPFLGVVNIRDSPIQFIVHESKEQLHQSIFTFDLPVCRNYFSKKAGLRIFRLEDLTTPSTTVETSQLLSRIYGLQVRTHLLPVYERNQKRIEKYRKRGFEVHIKLATPEVLRTLIPLKNEIPLFDLFYDIMGSHLPMSCESGFRCECKEQGYNIVCYRWYRNCECKAHVEFNAQAIQKYDAWRKKIIIQEHVNFWSNKL